MKNALESRLKDSTDSCNFLFQKNGRPLNYGTVAALYTRTLKKLGLPFTGTHIMRHGAASLARTVSGSIDGTMSITGHKDSRVAESYAELNDTVKINTSLKMEQHLKDLAGPITPKLGLGAYRGS